MAKSVIGQHHAIEAIVPYIEMYEAGLAPEGRPAGVFLLLGPTGTGKTRTAEALAEGLHGSKRAMLKIDCGEFQMDHEVAKLIGAPPGYLGHRETVPMLTQSRLASVTSERSPLSIVLFDEIEKAAPSLTRLLLGVLDRGVLRLGDNNMVNFERSVVLLTSNLGARGIAKELSTRFGFAADGAPPEERGARMHSIAMAAVKRAFSPEFINRIDVTVTYTPLSGEALGSILDHQIRELQRHIDDRLGVKGFDLLVTKEARKLLLTEAVSPEYGAREIHRTLHRRLMQPLAAMITTGEVEPGDRVVAEMTSGRLRLRAA